MTKRRRFTAEFKAKVALEALRGDKTIQEIASRHKVHPNQVSTWKRQAVEGLGDVFSNGKDKARADRESEIHDLHAKIDKLFMKHPFYGSRQMMRTLQRDGIKIGRHRVRRLMRLMGLEAIYQAPRTSKPHPEHRIYPWSLKGMAINRPNHVWCSSRTAFCIWWQ